MNLLDKINDIYSSPDKRSDHVNEINKSVRLMKEYTTNHYKHPFYTCIRDRGADNSIRWGCEIHTACHYKYFDTLIHHMLFFEPDKHKDYILSNTKQP
jgi:hypothetical protein